MNIPAPAAQRRAGDLGVGCEMRAVPRRRSAADLEILAALAGFDGSVQDIFPGPDRPGGGEELAASRPARKTGVYKDLIYPTGTPVSPALDPRLFKDNTIELNSALFPYLPNAAWASRSPSSIASASTASSRRDPALRPTKRGCSRCCWSVGRAIGRTARTCAPCWTAQERERGAPQATGPRPQRSPQGPQRHAGVEVPRRAGRDRRGGQDGRRRSVG